MKCHEGRIAAPKCDLEIVVVNALGLWFRFLFALSCTRFDASQRYGL